MIARHDDPTDPDLMSPEERTIEIATILGAGVLRLCRGMLAAHSPVVLISETLQNSLDDCRDESLNGRGQSVQKGGLGKESQ